MKYTFDLSVIVPVYKVERYINDCLDSLLRQRFDGNLQILLINDASPDASGEICDEYAARDSRIEYIKHKTNRGSSEARNTGLGRVHGRYFTFVDPDDILPEKALQALYDIAENYQADIAKGNNSILRRNVQVPANYNVKHLMTYSSGVALETFFEHDVVRGHPWGKIFRTERFSDLRFTPGVTMAQDLLYCAAAFSRAERLVVFPQTVYIYRLHGEGSTGRKYQTGAYLSWLNAVQASGHFCTNRAQHRSHQALQVRTLAQIAGEAERLEGEVHGLVLDEIERRMHLWRVTPIGLLAELQSFRTWFRYQRFSRRLRQLRKAQCRLSTS
jgi:glycosyltransferase involved in cell wall biosynthesis